MVIPISGSRNDSAWPPPGGTLHVPDDEGQDLINAGLAIKASEEYTEPKTEPGPGPETVTEPEPEEAAEPLEDLKSAAVDYAESEQDEPADENEPEQATDGPPKPAASKQEWIDWAVSQGAEWVTATNSTKQQLMEQYGQRP
jgi:hypothetical protein